MFIIGTAGHIDHGKTTLVRTITGIDTDRLKEEKERGISIELGFAYMELPGGQRVGLIDVPGHERFVHHMIAGASGVDIVMLVVAADEGVMPQTREHMAICELLGMSRGIVVLTKVDLVDPDWVELVKEDVSRSLGGSFLKAAPIIEFSAAWPQDRVAQFKVELSSLIRRLAESGSRINADRPLTMPVDRAFSIKGFGTVATGTVQTGSVATGDELLLLPQRRKTRVRRIEVHGTSATTASAGSRAALNLPEISRDEIERGAVLVHQDTLEPTSAFLGQISLLPTLPSPLKRQFKALFHTGASMAEATVRLLEPKELAPGQSGLVSIHLDKPVAFLSGQRFVVRGFTTLADYGKTLGGGTLLWPRFVRPKPRSLDKVAQLTASDPPQVIEAASYLAGPNGVRVRSLSAFTSLSEGQVAAWLAKPIKFVRKLGGKTITIVLHEEYWQLMVKKIKELLANYHSENPRKAGMPKEELKSRLPSHLDRTLVESVLAEMVSQKALRTDDLTVALATHSPQLDERFLAIKERLVQSFLSAGLETQDREELLKSFGAEARIAGEALARLVQEGVVAKITVDYYLHVDHLANAREKLLAFLKDNGIITTQQMKELFGLSRKFLIPLGEHFDSTRLTIRVGNAERKLRAS